MTTKTFTERREEAKKLGPIAESVFLASPGVSEQLDDERNAAEEAAASKAEKKAVKSLEGKPHHQRLEQLRAQSPLLATLYEQTNAFQLGLERDDDEPPPQAA